MLEEKKETRLIVGHASIAQDDSIRHFYGKIVVSIEVERETGVIVNFDMNTICKLTSDFTSELVKGLNIKTQFEEIENVIKSRYMGNSPLVILVAIRDARNHLINSPI